MKKKLTLTALLLAMVMLFSGCTTYDNFISAMKNRNTEVPEEETPVYIGVFEPLSGEFASGAEDEIAGIELAKELFPKVLGRPVELVYADNQSDATAAVTAAQSLVDAKVSCVIGSYRNMLSMAAQDLFEENHLPAIAVTNTNPLITQTSSYYFRVCIVDAFQGNSAARFIAEKNNRTRAAILKEESDDYAAALIEQFQSEMEELTGNSALIRVIEYPAGTEDFLPYLMRLDTMDIEHVFLPDDPVTADEIIWQAYNYEMDFTWVGISSWADIESAAESAGKERVDKYYLQGVNYVAYYDSNTGTTPMADKFMKAFQQKYPDRTPSDAVALGFDAYLFAINAIQKANRSDDGMFLQAVMAQIADLPGATGNITMTEYGDPVKDSIIVTIGDAK